jgi:glycosyltransferase involved in cell wall biosynthesis
MQIALSTLGTFHMFDLARELHAAQVPAHVFTAYPRFKLRQEQLPQSCIHTHPWIHAPYMAWRGRHRLGQTLNQWWERADRLTLDHFVARHMQTFDVLVGMSGSSLLSGQAIQARGGRYVCDRGSTHIRVQDALLREEAERWGAPVEAIDPWVIEREEAEYQQADCITVPSTFNVRSFVSQGVPAHKIRRLPYGVNLSRFQPVSAPAAGRFDMLFVGAVCLRKGVPYLLQAFKQLRHPRKTLTFAGTLAPGLIDLMERHGLWSSDFRILGHVPQPDLKRLMSESHCLVLPSIEEGLALVQAQAMACGCPVVASDHTGSEDLFVDGEHGFITSARDASVLADRLQRLADDEALRADMGRKALAHVQSAGGWKAYGQQAMCIYRGLA